LYRFVLLLFWFWGWLGVDDWIGGLVDKWMRGKPTDPSEADDWIGGLLDKWMNEKLTGVGGVCGIAEENRKIGLFFGRERSVLWHNF
jgi:hypothetical protein